MCKIDCSLAENFIIERQRMCNSKSMCGLCGIHIASNTDDLSEVGCMEWTAENPQQAIEIVQAWSDEHPREKVVTYLDKLLEVFPNIELSEIDGTPRELCPKDLGLKELDCIEECLKCWNQPYKENTNGE